MNDIDFMEVIDLNKVMQAEREYMRNHINNGNLVDGEIQIVEKSGKYSLDYVDAEIVLTQKISTLIDLLYRPYATDIMIDKIEKVFNS